MKNKKEISSKQKSNGIKRIVSGELPLAFGDWLCDNARPAYTKNDKQYWQLHRLMKKLKWNDTFKTTEELYRMFASGNFR